MSRSVTRIGPQHGPPTLVQHLGRELQRVREERDELRWELDNPEPEPWVDFWEEVVVLVQDVPRGLATWNDVTRYVKERS